MKHSGYYFFHVDVPNFFEKYPKIKYANLTGHIVGNGSL
jgi:hypothetical protein